MGYAATAIVAWAVQGPYYSTAYIAKGIEVALITLLAIDFARMDGNPIKVVKGELALLGAKLGRRPAAGPAGAVGSPRILIAARRQPGRLSHSTHTEPAQT
jgi:hypothetical protein